MIHVHANLELSIKNAVVSIRHREVFIDMWDGCMNTIVMKKVMAELELIFKLMS